MQRGDAGGVVARLHQGDLDGHQHEQPQRPRRIAAPGGADQRGDQREQRQPVRHAAADLRVQLEAVEAPK